MILIVGGRGAGKREFAQKTLGCAPEKTLPDLQDREPLPSLEELLGYEAVICDEVGCGVVPVEPAQRARREAVGRLCCRLAERAERVERIFCGLPMVLKD
mgnify:CR=1 FL=1